MQSITVGRRDVFDIDIQSETPQPAEVPAQRRTFVPTYSNGKCAQGTSKMPSCWHKSVVIDANENKRPSINFAMSSGGMRGHKHGA